MNNAKDLEQLKNKTSCLYSFAVAGDPDIDKSLDIFKAYIDGGADILEIGYPFLILLPTDLSISGLHRDNCFRS